MQATNQVGQRLAVHALAGEDTEMARGGDALLHRTDLLPHEVGQLHQENLFGVEQFQVFQRRLGGEQVEGVQPQAEIRHVGAADHLPCGGELVDGAAPGQPFIGHLDAQRDRQHRQLAQVFGNGVQILRGVDRGRRADQQDLRAQCGAHLQHGLGDVDLVVVQVAGEALEVAQHLKAGHAQAAGAHRLYGGVQPVRVADDVARRQHDLAEAGRAHLPEFGLQRAGQ
ncbi:MAG: hypothetical protein BWX79_03317 [Alphaproteobacteria bacterium ADurb.Bin100]|nr:MAG: hypothetical protein BWX79_03317 [Alphaproteobacteria bacterium ADurb.Bin100]